MRAYLAVRRAFEMIWDVTRGAIAVLLGIAASLALLIVVIALLAGVLAAVAKVWPS